MERYREIVNDFSKFREECEKPARKTVRKNSIKANSSFEQELKEKFPNAEKSTWNPEIYRLNTESSPGKTMLHWHGDYYVQEESASIPVNVLDPTSGDEILDMCAAPGGKTTQIASKISNKGLIISNDKSGKRLQSLHANIYRTGSTSVKVTDYDGRRIPKNRKYDKILVDAPCTGEGEKARRNFESASKQKSIELANLQKKLLENAEKLLKENGNIVYSTCTFSPEENEGVVKRTIEQTDLRICNISTEAPHRKGVKDFKKEQFGSEMKKTIRTYPHHLKSGGIYVAKLKK